MSVLGRPRTCQPPRPRRHRGRGPQAREPTAKTTEAVALEMHRTHLVSRPDASHSCNPRRCTADRRAGGRATHTPNGPAHRPDRRGASRRMTRKPRPALWRWDAHQCIPHLRTSHPPLSSRAYYVVNARGLIFLQPISTICTPTTTTRAPTLSVVTVSGAHLTIRHWGHVQCRRAAREARNAPAGGTADPAEALLCIGCLFRTALGGDAHG